jgi:phosphatidate cytidylyltransferase
MRILSAMVLAPLAIGAAYLGGAAFAGFWGLAAIGVMWEWSALVLQRPSRPVLGVATATLAAAAALFAIGRAMPAIAAIGVGTLACAALAPAGRRGWIGAGEVCAGVMLTAVVALRADAEYGFVAILFLFAIVWTTDIFAYFIGRLVGGPRLWPRVSPNKTWSGVIGGLLCATIAGSSVVPAAGLDRLSASAVVAFGLSLATASGDLLESALKRRFGAKDASRLIPGHGGLMDRLDGFLTAALAGAMLGLARGGLDAPARGLLIW